MEFLPGKTPWHIPADVALPSATQNELDEQDARTLIKNGVLCVAEGANMPSTNEAAKVFETAGVLYAPGKASKSGTRRGYRIVRVEVKEKGLALQREPRR